MTLTELDPSTGLPRVKEERPDSPFRSLPREIGALALELDSMAEGTPWYPASHEWEAHILMRVRCIKCGRDLKGWRMMLDRSGNQVKIAGNPAVAFLPYNHLTSTLVAVRLPKMNRTFCMSALHCLDCSLAPEDALHVFTCCVAGMDAVLSHAVRQQSARMHPDAWATFLFRFGQAEPIGPVTEGEASTMERLPAPGELLSAGQFALYVDAAQRNKIPSGVVVEFQGNEIPMGWAEVRPGFIRKL